MKSPTEIVSIGVNQSVALTVARMLQTKKQFQAKERTPEIATEDNRGVYHFLGWKLGDLVKTRPRSVRNITKIEIRVSCV